MGEEYQEVGHTSYLLFSSLGVARAGEGRNRKSVIEITPQLAIFIVACISRCVWREKRQNMRQINVRKTRSKMADLVRAALLCPALLCLS